MSASDAASVPTLAQNAPAVIRERIRFMIKGESNDLVIFKLTGEFVTARQRFGYGTYGEYENEVAEGSKIRKAGVAGERSFRSALRRSLRAHA